MIKKITAAFLLMSSFVFSQNYQTVEEVDNVCSQLGFTSDEEAQIAVDKILDEIGIPIKSFKLRSCPNINNAIAKNIKDANGNYARYILYDINFMKRISDNAQNDWSAISVLAHEIGHHLSGHSLNNKGSNHKWELEADYFSGVSLAKMGASLQESQSAIQTLRYEKATSTHPAKADRLKEIEKGWNKGVSHLKIIKENTKEIANPTSASEVVSNFINAIRGEIEIESIKTTSVLYSCRVQGMSIELSIKQKYPNKYYSAIESNGRILNKQVYNGREGYTEAMGTKIPLFGEDLERIKNSSALFGLDLGRTTEFDGVERFNNAEVYVLKNELSKYYFDKKTNLKLGETIGFKNALGNITYQTSTYKNYQDVKGILYPHKIIVDNGNYEMNFELINILINEGVSDSDFE